MYYMKSCMYFRAGCLYVHVYMYICILCRTTSLGLKGHVPASVVQIIIICSPMISAEH